MEKLPEPDGTRTALLELDSEMDWMSARANAADAYQPSLISRLQVGGSTVAIWKLLLVVEPSVTIFAKAYWFVVVTVLGVEVPHVFSN